MSNYDLSWPGSYPGSSGFGIRPDGSYGPITNPRSQPVNNTTDYGVFDAASGKVVSLRTRQPWNGTEPRTGKSYTGGVESAASAQSVNVPGVGQVNPNDPNQRYRAVDIPKSPDVSAAQQDLMQQFRHNADSALTDFGSHLRSFQTDLTGARTAASAATDIGPTTQALTQAAQRYGTGLDQSTAEYRQALADAAANQRGVVSQANALLPQYDQAATNIEQQQLAQVMRNFSKYKMGTGTPTSPGGSESQILAGAAQNVMLPIEMNKIGQRYNILTGLSMPTESAIAGRNIGFAGSYLPGVAGSRYGADTQLPLQIQQLKNQVAGMSYQNALQFLQAQGVPAQMQNQILAGQTGTLGALGSLEDQSRYRGLQDVLGANVTSPMGYDNSLPAYPQYPTRYPATRTGTTPAPGLTATNAPQQVGTDPYAQNNATYANDPYFQSLYQNYGLTPADYASMYTPPVATPGAPGAYAGPIGQQASSGNFTPEWMAGGVY